MLLLLVPAQVDLAPQILHPDVGLKWKQGRHARAGERLSCREAAGSGGQGKLEGHPAPSLRTALSSTLFQRPTSKRPERRCLVTPRKRLLDSFLSPPSERCRRAPLQGRGVRQERASMGAGRVHTPSHLACC